MSVSGETCTFHPEVSADARCSKCSRPFCRACLTLVFQPSATMEGIPVGGSGGLVCVECKIKEEGKSSLMFALMGLLWLFSGLFFISAIPPNGRGFFAGPMTFVFLIALGMIAFGVVRYASRKDKLQKFEASLPLKAKFPVEIELGVAKCPNCGGTLKKVPHKPGEVVLCSYCEAPIVVQYRAETKITKD